MTEDIQVWLKITEHLLQKSQCCCRQRKHDSSLNIMIQSKQEKLLERTKKKANIYLQTEQMYTETHCKASTVIHITIVF